MTAYHVVESVRHPIEANLICRFDYRSLPNGNVPRGHEYRLSASEWLAAFSAYDESGISDFETANEADTDHLDYALLRLDGRPGAEPIAESSRDLDAPSRGWIELPRVSPSLALGSPLIIVDYSQGQPLQVAMGGDIVRVNASRTRLWYRTNTAAGSAGAPCFSQNWELIALHHAGRSQVNEGIPMEAIVADLNRRRLFERLIGNESV